MKLHSSQVLLFCLSAFLCGVGLQTIIPQYGRVFLYAVAILAVVMATTFWGKYWSSVTALCLLSLAGGIFVSFQSRELAADNISAYNGAGQITLKASVVAEPDERDDKVNLTLAVSEVLRPKPAKASGKVLLTVARYPQYRYGDELEVSGKPETPFVTEEFSYKNYLAKSAIYSVERFAQVRKLGEGRGNFFVDYLLRFKTAFTTGLAKILPEPQNALLAGLLIGAKRGIGEELLAQFKTAGVSHIIAISGFNISIITRILGSFLRRKFGPRWALILCVLFVLGFVVITGAQASVVRAAVMGLLAMLALNAGRASRALKILLIAAAVMVAVNPPILVFDVGFQLSFLATGGLIFLSAPLEKIFAFVPEAFALRASLASTLSAQIFVLPLLIYYFDQLSLVAPLANLFVLPVIPLTMLVGFISGILALVASPLSYPTVWMVWLLLTYLIKVIEFFSSIPYAAMSISGFSVLWVVNYYLVLTLIVFGLQIKSRELKIWNFFHPAAS